MYSKWTHYLLIDFQKSIFIKLKKNKWERWVNIHKFLLAGGELNLKIFFFEEFEELDKIKKKKEVKTTTIRVKLREHLMRSKHESYVQIQFMDLNWIHYNSALNVPSLVLSPHILNKIKIKK